MKRLIILIVLLAPSMALARPVDFYGYQKPDGAITTHFQGDKVDPYFATKALLTAEDEGFDARRQALDWIDWVIAQQRPDGLFDRYVLAPSGGQWTSYTSTDADDAMSALWLELLYRMAPNSGIPDKWQASLRNAEKRLNELYDPISGTYNISRAHPVGLLMDNVEIYAAFRRIAMELHRFGSAKKADFYEAKADRLKQDILRLFRLQDGKTFLISSQARTDLEFYPDAVGQLYPYLYQMLSEDPAFYTEWVHLHEGEWIAGRTNDYPWGLVAILALRMRDPATAACWQSKVAPMRYSGRWNVLEEVAFQSVTIKLTYKFHYQDIACIGKTL